MSVTRGVPQGSELELLLWYVAYDTVFCLPLPRWMIVVGFADDTMNVVVENTVEAMQNRTNAALAGVHSHSGLWLPTGCL